MGCEHAHLVIRFEDGMRWLMRVPRRNFRSIPDDLRDLILTSECATLRWLETSGVPVPRLHGYGLRGDPSNRVGVAYMLFDELPGKPFWSPNASPDQRRKVLSGLADILLKLSNRPLDRFGSLTFDEHGKISVGPMLGDRISTLSSLGPFDSAKEFYTAWCEEHLKFIADRQLFIRYPINAYLIYRFIKKKAEEGKWNDFEERLDQPPFYLKHMDDKGDHILVDDDFNITGIIDWTFARTAPLYEVFGPSLITVDLKDQLAGTVRGSDADQMLLSALQEKCPARARFAAATDKVRRLMTSLGLGMDVAWDEALSQFKAIVSTFGEDMDGFCWDDWRQRSIDELHGDERFHALMSDLKINPGSEAQRRSA